MLDIMLFLRADICCMVIILLLFIKSFTTLGNNSESKSIRKVMIAAFIYIAAYSYEELVMCQMISTSVAQNTFVTIVIQASQTLLCYWWLLYSERKQKSVLTDSRKKCVMWGIPVAVFVLILLLSIKTHWIFDFRADGTYVRGKFFFLQYVLIVGYLFPTSLKALYYSVQKENYVRASEYKTLFLFILAPTAAVIYQAVLPGSFMVGVGLTISFILLYINNQQETISCDYLTKLNNRQQLVRFLSKKIKESENLYLIIMDANKFKHINDVYGHVEGDRALVIIAETLKNVAGLNGGFVSRYGGDEFVFVYETEEEKNVEALCCRIHEMLQEAKQKYALKYSLTLSFGYAKCPDKFIAVQELIRLADEQLYIMKRRSYTNLI
ncbi:GGDEF domain-containing protein [Eisenbergiella sp.]